MTDIHVAVGIVLLALNGLAAAWGGIAYLRGIPSVSYWYVLRAAQASIVVQAVIGVILLARGTRPPDDLHYLYGIAPLAVMLVSEAMRYGAAERELEHVDDVEALEHREQVLLARRVVMREMAVMTVGTLLIVTLALRAAAVNGGFV